MCAYKSAIIGLVALAAGAVTACCTLEIRAAVYGTISWPNGDPVTPDAVVSIVDGVEESCAFDVGQYDCFERGSGTYTLRVEVDSAQWQWDVSVAADDTCHVEPLERDLVLATP